MFKKLFRKITTTETRKKQICEVVQTYDGYSIRRTDGLWYRRREYYDDGYYTGRGDLVLTEWISRLARGGVDKRAYHFFGHQTVRDNFKDLDKAIEVAKRMEQEMSASFDRETERLAKAKAREKFVETKVWR